MQDIHGNVLSVGDRVYGLTSIHRGSQSKRLFYAEVISIGKYIKIKCFENSRIVDLTGQSVIKPLDY
jgi:hypothetical protein